MSERLVGYAAVNVDGRDVSVDPSTDLSSLDAATLKALRKAGALVKADEAPSRGAALDVASAGVEEIGRHIDESNLNGPDTVALAKDDPALAQKVIDAENLAAGGDGRKTVIGPLEKLAEG